MSSPAFDPDGPAEGDGIFGLPTPTEDAALVLLPVPWEVTASYRGGTSQAPEAIFAASHQVELFDLEVGTPYEHGITWTPPDPRVAAWHQDAAAAKQQGDVPRVNDLCEQMVKAVFRATQSRLDEGRVVGVVGGDHSVALGAIEAAAGTHAGMGVLQVDAHPDLREAYEGYVHSHASVMHNILERAEGLARLVQVGIRDLGEREYDRIRIDPRIACSFDRDLHRLSWEEVIAPLPHAVWVSWDIDGLSPALCPSTGTPVPGGLSWNQATDLMRALVESGRRIVGFDLCEVSPGHGWGDPAGAARLGESWDAAVGARLLYRLCGWTLQSRS